MFFQVSRRGVGEVEELSGEEHLLRDEQGVSCTARFIAQHVPKFSSDPCFLDTVLQMVGEWTVPPRLEWTSPQI